MKIVFAFVVVLLCLVPQGCIEISFAESRVQECEYAVFCRVNDEEGRPIPEACLFYGFDMPAGEYLSWGGATMCQVAVADENGLICVDAVEVNDAGFLLWGWDDLEMFITAPGYAPVLYDGQSEVELIRTDEFEGVFYDKDWWRPYARLKGADPCCRVPLKILSIDLNKDVVTQGPGAGLEGEIARRTEYFNRYVKVSPFVLPKPAHNGERRYVFAIYDQRYTLAKRLCEKKRRVRRGGESECAQDQGARLYSSSNETRRLARKEQHIWEAHQKKPVKWLLLVMML